MKSLVSCRDCRNYTPDALGDGLGNGQCKIYNDYAAQKPRQSELDAFVQKLGNQYGYSLFWPGSIGDKNRQCDYYQA